GIRIRPPVGAPVGADPNSHPDASPAMPTVEAMPAMEAVPTVEAMPAMEAVPTVEAMPAMEAMPAATPWVPCGGTDAEQRGQDNDDPHPQWRGPSPRMRVTHGLLLPPACHDPLRGLLARPCRPPRGQHGLPRPARWPSSGCRSGLSCVLFYHAAARKPPQRRL